MRIFVLGASGEVGSRLVRQAAARGHRLTAQTRTAGRVSANEAVSIAIGRPEDAAFLTHHMDGHDAIALCLGVDRLGDTTLFSDSTRAVLAAMRSNGVRRLVAITGVGAGETRGHGGWLYNAIVFPLFTRRRYADKDRQEQMIAASGVDWTIVRPAPFAARSGGGAMQVVTDFPPDLQLRSVTRDEVAAFVLDCIENALFIHRKPFIGRP